MTGYKDNLRLSTFNYDDLCSKNKETKLNIYTEFNNNRGGENNLLYCSRRNLRPSHNKSHELWPISQLPIPSVNHLHGSVAENNIIPPSQAKNFNDPNIQESWKESIDFLKDADHLVVCGYSVPITDVFFDHFLAIARMESEHSKPMTITFINPSMDEERVKKKISPILFKGGRLNFISGEKGKFENLFIDFQAQWDSQESKRKVFDEGDRMTIQRFEEYITNFNGKEVELAYDSPLWNLIGKLFGLL